jgi:hypothetical protein
MYNLNSFFDKVYVITCDGFHDRHSYICSHFKKHNIQFEFKSSIHKNILKNNSNLNNSELSLLYGHLHCIIDSHINGYKHILICEDDIKFIDNIHIEFGRFITNVPENWNFLQLGNQFWATKWLRRSKIKNNLYDFKWGTGSHCVAINSNVYSDTIEFFSKQEYPSDFAYYNQYLKYHCYCPKQFLADALSYPCSFEDVDDKYHLFNSTIKHSH